MTSNFEHFIPNTACAYIIPIGVRCGCADFYSLLREKTDTKT